MRVCRGEVGAGALIAALRQVYAVRGGQQFKAGGEGADGCALAEVERLNERLTSLERVHDTLDVTLAEEEAAFDTALKAKKEVIENKTATQEAAVAELVAQQEDVRAQLAEVRTLLTQEQRDRQAAEDTMRDIGRMLRRRRRMLRRGRGVCRMLLTHWLVQGRVSRRRPLRRRFEEKMQVHREADPPLTTPPSSTLSCAMQAASRRNEQKAKGGGGARRRVRAAMGLRIEASQGFAQPIGGDGW